jgi:hypothetical protein
MKLFWSWHKHYSGTRWFCLEFCPCRRRWSFQVYKLFISLWLRPL